MTNALRSGTPVTVVCPHSDSRLRRVVVEQLTAGPRAGWVRLQRPDGEMEDRTMDALRIETRHESPSCSECLEFYHRDERRVLERRPLSGMVGQLTSARAEISRIHRVREQRVGIRLVT